jgi:bifunctional DNase/RNase
MTDAPEPIRMEIKGLMLDPSSNVPIVILRDLDNSIFLPIWIGVFEANAIALQMEQVEPPRPLTHDLLRTSLEILGAKVNQVLISGLEESTFFAQIFLATPVDEKILDARPSDAIALALRVNAPIFVLPAVLEKAKAVELATNDEDRLRKWLEEVDPSELGQYKM